MKRTYADRPVVDYEYGLRYVMKVKVSYIMDSIISHIYVFNVELINEIFQF